MIAPMLVAWKNDANVGGKRGAGVFNHVKRIRFSFFYAFFVSQGNFIDCISIFSHIYPFYACHYLFLLRVYMLIFFSAV